MGPVISIVVKKITLDPRNCMQQVDLGIEETPFEDICGGFLFPLYWSLMNDLLVLMWQPQWESFDPFLFADTLPGIQWQLDFSRDPVGTANHYAESCVDRIVKLGWFDYLCHIYLIMTSSNGNIFRVTGNLYGEFTGPRWIPRT